MRSMVEKDPKIGKQRLRFAALFFCAAALITPGNQAQAQEEEESSEDKEEKDGMQAALGLQPSPIDLLYPKERIKRFSISADVERWTPKDENIALVYPEAAWRGTLHLGFFINRQINPTISAGISRLEGNAVGLVTQTPSDVEATMYVAPLEFSLLYRFDYSWDQVIQPFIGIGGDAWAYRESAPDAITSGIKWGVHGTAGMIFRLNFMEITSGWAPVTGVYPTDAGLSAAVTYAWVDSFAAPGMDFSGLRFTLGGYLAF